MPDVFGDILAKKRDRAIATILGTKERECDSFLPPDSQRKLRKVVLDQLNDFYDISLDIIKSLNNGQVVINEVYLERVNELHSMVKQLHVGNGDV